MQSSLQLLALGCCGNQTHRFPSIRQHAQSAECGNGIKYTILSVYEYKYPLNFPPNEILVVFNNILARNDAQSAFVRHLEVFW